MSRGGFLEGLEGAGFPRVSGDEPAAIDGYSPNVKFSPRERG